MSQSRRSARLASSQDSSPPKSAESSKGPAGTKRKSELSQSPTTKRGRWGASKQQTTIEESMDIDNNTEDTAPATSKNGDKPVSDNSSKSNPETSKPSESNGESVKEQQNGSNGDKIEENAYQDTENKSQEQDVEQPEQRVQHQSESKPNDQSDEKPRGKPANDTSNMDDTGEIKPTENSTADEKPATNGDSAVETHARDEETPASILEKGLIYFFIRGRVGIDDPSDVNDIARSYMILRPIPHGAKLGDGPIGSGDSKCRLLALPKKVLPVSGKDKFMVFVESTKTTFSELKESFLSASDYTTQTAGARHTPSANPVAEGVYAITTTGRESHLAYMLTIPQELDEVQKDIGLREQGSFITSVKNPQYAGPANTNLPQGPDFPKEILDEFRSLRWCPLQPKFLDYENVQFLIIGESSGIDKALEPQGNNNDGTAEEMKKEMEKLEGEDEIRIKHLRGDDAIFADLGVSKKDYNLQTTWGS